MGNDVNWAAAQWFWMCLFFLSQSLLDQLTTARLHSQKRVATCMLNKVRHVLLSCSVLKGEGEYCTAFVCL